MTGYPTSPPKPASNTFLRQYVSSIDDNIGAGSVAGCVRSQVKEGSLELVGFTLTTTTYVLAYDMTTRFMELHTPWESCLSRCSWSLVEQNRRSQLPCIRERLSWHVQTVPTQQPKNGLLEIKLVADLPDIKTQLRLTQVDDTSLGAVVRGL